MELLKVQILHMKFSYIQKSLIIVLMRLNQFVLEI